MATRSLPLKTDCPIETTLAVVGGVWKPLILYALLDGKKRFGELSRLVPKATQRVLTMHLRELEADGAIKRTVYAEVLPLRVEYELTETGRSLERVLSALYDWGEQHRAKVNGGNGAVDAEAGEMMPRDVERR